MSDHVPSTTMRRFARQQRANAVTAETVVWRAVRDRRCAGFKFQRQVVLGRFIVDFVCFEMRLVIEVDGPSHLPKESEAHDSRRDAWLASQGFRILRLPNDLVIGSTEPAIERIRTALTSNIRPDLR